MKQGRLKVMQYAMSSQSSSEESQEEFNGAIQEINVKKRSKRQNVDAKTWKPNAQKQRREKNLPYQDKKKSWDILEIWH